MPRTFVVKLLEGKTSQVQRHFRFWYSASLRPRQLCCFNFRQLSNSLHLSSTQHIPHLLTILCSICRPKDKDKVLHSRLPVLEPLKSMKSTSSAAYERSLRMMRINSNERTSSSSYITTRMAEKFLLQDKLSGFSMGESLIRCRRKSPKAQQCGLKKFVFLSP